MIRPATIADTMAIVALLKHAHDNSLYVRFSEVRPDITQKFVRDLILGMGLKSKTATLIWVAEEGGVIVGIMAAAKGPIYFIGEMLGVQEVFFYGNRDLVSAADMKALFVRFNTWADSDERVVEVKVSSSDIFPHIDFRDLRAFYQRHGFELSGEVFVRRKAA